MGVFIQPPFWAVGYRRRVAPHAVSVLVTPPVLEPLTLDQAKLRAGLDWTVGDPRDDLMRGFIAAARAKVEQDTGLALLEQTRDVLLDAVPGWVIQLPAQSMPLKSVTSVQTTDMAGALNTLDPANYVIDFATARLGLALSGVWPTDLRPFQPWVIRIIAGYPDVETLTAIHPLLIHAVGLLTAHYATLGRDLASINQAYDVPHGYEDAISGYVPVTLA